MKLKLMKAQKLNLETKKILITIQVEFDHLGCFPNFNKIPKLTTNLIEDHRISD